ncbi:MAG: hypothetical protein CL927_07960 [Deltaproteobacteria bacterium]|nr:hypothetical protein [Deltaproteobacteria bacterium]
MRLAAIPCLLAASLIGSTALAGKKDVADYGFLMGISPFGGTVNFVYNQNKKNSWNFAVGSSMPITLGATIEDTEYDVTGDTKWSGIFWNHRPVKKADWFRFVSGIGVGRINIDIEDTTTKAKYQAVYSENPVLYTGLGFGNKPVKGFLYGFDLGVLATGGTNVMVASETSTQAQADEIADNWRFGSVLPNFQFTIGYGW